MSSPIVPGVLAGTCSHYDVRDVIGASGLAHTITQPRLLQNCAECLATRLTITFERLKEIETAIRNEIAAIDKWLANPGPAHIGALHTAGMAFAYKEMRDWLATRALCTKDAQEFLTGKNQ